MDILHQTMKEGFHVTNHKSRIGMHLTLTFRVKHGFGADLTFFMLYRLYRKNMS